MLALQRDTSGRGAKIIFSDMQENGAASTPAAGRHIIPKHGNGIVKVILTPKRLGTCRIGEEDHTIVIAIGRRIAPAEGAARRLHGQSCNRPCDTVGSIKKLKERPMAKRRGAVSLFFVCSEAGLPKGSRKA